MMLTFAIVEEIFTLKSQNSVHYLRFFRIGTLKNIRLPQTWFVFLGGLLTFFLIHKYMRTPYMKPKFTRLFAQNKVHEAWLNFIGTMLLRGSK